MSKKQKTFKGIFLVFLCLLSLAMALHSFIGLETKWDYVSSGTHIQHSYYGGDAYTGIQNAAADTGNNVLYLQATVRSIGNQIISIILVTSAFIFTFIFFVCLYLTIKTFAEKAIDEKRHNIEGGTAIETSNFSDCDLIEKYSLLKERGHLSEEEFNAKKKQLLGL